MVKILSMIDFLMGKNRRPLDHSLGFHSRPTQTSFKTPSPSSKSYHFKLRRPLDFGLSVKGREAGLSTVGHSVKRPYLNCKPRYHATNTRCKPNIICHYGKFFLVGIIDLQCVVIIVTCQSGFLSIFQFPTTIVHHELLTTEGRVLANR